jgi:hypothetical protein
MTDNIRQFKINGKQVEFSNDKKSISKDLYAKDAILNSIFEKLNKADANGNIDDILDEKEIKDFQQKIIDTAGEDGDLTSEEAHSLLDSIGLKEVDTNKFFGFIQSMFSKDDTKEVISDAAEQPHTSEDSEEEQITRGVIVKNPEKYEQARKLNEEVKTRNTAKGIAKEFYQIADNYSGPNSINRMQKLLDTKVSAKNITQFLDEYDKFKQGDSSIIDTITSEVGASGTIQQKKVLVTLMDKLSQAARQAGVSEAEIKKANADFLKAYNVEYK